jgi:hypothetical protein
VEHAAVLLNPVISTLQQQTAAATVSLLSEIDALQVPLLLIVGCLYSYISGVFLKLLLESQILNICDTPHSQ